MLQVIKDATRNYFHSFKPLRGFGINHKGKPMEIHGDIPEGAFFTSSELDQLKEVLRWQIGFNECILATQLIVMRDRLGLRTLAKKEIHKTKKRIKLLAGLQKKVKHSIITKD